MDSPLGAEVSVLTDLPTKKALMQDRVITHRYQFKICDGVVGLVAIAMVNLFM